MFTYWIYSGNPTPEQDIEHFPHARKMSGISSQAMCNTPTIHDPEITTILTFITMFSNLIK